MSSARPRTLRDQEAVAQFVERFASALADGGFPRMPARVFVALLATDSGRLTASELASQLGVSRGAISGAVRYLTQIGLASREREPGTRRDVFRIHEDAWYDAAIRREPMLERWKGSAREGVDALGADTPAGARLAETLEYFEFVQNEVAEVLERWRAHQARIRP